MCLWAVTVCRFLWWNDLTFKDVAILFMGTKKQLPVFFFFVCLEVWKFGIDEFTINMETLNPNNYTFSFISTFNVLCGLNIWCGSHIVASITGQNGNCGFKNKDMFRHNWCLVVLTNSHKTIKLNLPVVPYVRTPLSVAGAWEWRVG